MDYNFDKVIDRHNTGCVKYDGMTMHFGRNDLLPLWVADMDFEACPAVYEALNNRLNHKIYGYAIAPDSYWESILSWLQRRHNLSWQSCRLSTSVADDE